MPRIALLPHPDFRKLWAGQTISEIGSRISREGLPYTALLLLNATPAQMGIISALSAASILLFSFVAGVVVDRLRKRPVMIATDLGRAALLATIPLAAFAHRLSFTHLLVITALTGILTVLFDVAYQSYLPFLLERDQLMEANRQLAMSSATAEMLGPSLAGILVQAITAPFAILLDALSFLVSAASVSLIRKPESQPQPAAGVPIKQEIFEGMQTIWANQLLRHLLLRSANAFLFGGFVFSLYLYAAIRIIHLSTSALGLTIALGGAGGISGAYFAERISNRFGTGKTFFASALFAGAAQLLIPLSATYPKAGLLCLACQQFLGDCAATVYMVNETTLRQRAVPEHLLGRVNAAMQLASRGMLPIGALIGGYLAGLLGVPAVLWIGTLGFMASAAWLIPITTLNSAEKPT